MEDKNNNDSNSSSLATIISDVIALFVLLLICEMCGCHVFSRIGHSIGECVNAYRQSASQVHPSDLR